MAARSSSVASRRTCVIRGLRNRAASFVFPFEGISRNRARSFCRILCAGVLALWGFHPAVAQQNQNPNANGIVIDAEGVVRPALARNASAALSKKQREAFANENLSSDVQAYSPLRMVSLPRLERSIAAALGSGSPLTEEMQHLAGLQRIDYVFVNPEGNDVVLAGPAEGFAPDAGGRMIGLTTGRPPLVLDDLLAAWRSVLGGESSIGCSIDPDEGRLGALQEFAARNSSPTSSAGARRRFAQMAEILGMENVVVWGVPQDSHFGRVLVEADYRMKRISLGAEPSGVRSVRSHLSLLTPSGNSMQRWWFAPLYDSISAGDDGNAYQLTGQRVQLLSQEEHLAADGSHSDAPFTRASTQKFAQLFTEHYEDLAAVSPVFAELQNLFDLAVVAALLRKQNVFDRAGWRGELLLDSERLPLEAVNAPRSVPSEAMTRPAQRGTMLGLVGGVTLDPFDVVETLVADGPAAENAAAQSQRSAVPPSDAARWWWD